MKFLRPLLLVVFGLMPMVCLSGGIKQGGPHYYSSFKTKSLPERPTGELTATEATKPDRSAYYVAFYDSKGNIEKFTKYRLGKIDWESTYEYSSDGVLLQGRNICQTGKNSIRIEYKFDKSGTLLKRTRFVNDKIDE